MIGTILLLFIFFAILGRYLLFQEETAHKVSKSLGGGCLGDMAGMVAVFVMIAILFFLSLLVFPPG